MENTKKRSRKFLYTVMAKDFLGITDDFQQIASHIPIATYSTLKEAREAIEKIQKNGRYKSRYGTQTENVELYLKMIAFYI